MMGLNLEFGEMTIITFVIHALSLEIFFYFYKNSKFRIGQLKKRVVTRKWLLGLFGIEPHCGHVFDVNESLLN